MKISAISIDMFQTLIDVDERVNDIWKSILGDDYRQESVQQYVKEYYECYDRIMETEYGTNGFTNLKIIFTAVFSQIKCVNNCNCLAGKATEILMEAHSKARFFTDATAFLNQWTHEYELWISSDADHVMVDPLLPKIKFDRKFISEDVKAYKRDKQDRFFKKIVSDTNINASEIIHIGDSLSDIVGAKRMGIKACWINRSNSTWNHPCCPDYTISNLIELPELLQKLKE